MSERSASAAAAQGATTGSASASPDEPALLLQAKAGVSAAFDQLVTIHQEKIARLVQRLLGWPSEVDDVVQDVFVDALRNLSRFDGRSKVLTWLTRLAINRCRTHQRKQWIRLGFLRRLKTQASIEHSTKSLHSSTINETIHQIHTAIQQLKQRDREIIILRYLEEQTIDEITHALGVSRGAVDVRLTRARQRLETISKPYIEQ